MLQYNNAFTLSICIAAILFLGGCATAPVVVRPGDKVEMSFTCRLPGGELAVTTRPDSDVAGEKKSPLYLQRSGPETVSVQAGETQRIPGVQGIKPFEQEAMDLLATHTIGAPVGVRRSIVLAAPRYTGLPKNEEYISIARIRHYPKTISMMPEEYSGRTGRKPEAGQPYVVDPAIPGTVSEVSDKEVVVRFTAQAGDSVTTPFGNGVIRESDSEYSYGIDAKKGTLVRITDSVGRIVDVGEDTIGLDYGHPFGGETLQCDMTVKSVDSSARTASTAGEATPLEAGKAASPDAFKEEKLAGILADALAKATKVDSVVEDFDKAFAASGPGNAKAAVSVESANPSGAQAMLTANSGDLATVDYKAMLEDGSIFFTTRKEVAENTTRKMVPWYVTPKSYEPEAITVGKPALLPAVGEAVAGMKPGETKRLILAPEQAFGQPDPRKRTQFPLVVTLPRVVTLPADEYVKRAGSFPVKGQELPLTPYFPARVTAVRDRDVDLEFQVEDGKSFSEPFGTTIVKKTEKEIITTLSPVIGSSFPLQEGAGIITASDGKTFTVDQNHPLAGKSVVIDLTLTGLTKAADLQAGDLPWQEEHDAGLAMAKKAGKPAVLILYADWCGFCKKLFSETMPDPRISSLRDRFAWIRVNSDKLTDIKKLYGQNGYPMIVLFNSDGSVGRKLDGYQEASVLRAALQEVP